MTADTAVANRVSRREWRWVLGASAVILLLTSLPYLYGLLLSSPEAQFGGFVIGVEDGNSYLAKMRLGATDGWRFHLFYTSEPHDGAYLFLFHLLLGKIARLLAAPPWAASGPSPAELGTALILVYHLARVGCGLLLLATVYRFVAFFTARRPVRRLAFWLVGTGSGLGWLVVLLGLAGRLGLPLDFYSPEAFAFHALFGLPHLALAEAFLLWGVLLLSRAWEERRTRYALLAGLSLAGMTVLAAFYVLVAAAVIGSGWLLRRLGRRGPPWAEAGWAVLTLSIPAPVALYNAYVFLTNPVLKIWGEQNRILSPSPLHYLLAFGPLALLAALGGRAVWRRVPGRYLLLGWCAVTPLMVYIPFNLQRRLTLGVQVPLAILAALSLWRLSRPERNPRRWRILSVGTAVVLSLSNLMLVAGGVLEVSRRAAPLFHAGAVVSAADWLGTHATADQVVLAAYETGNYLPTRMSARVFAGHGPETVHSDVKRALLRRFFGPGDDDFRRRLLQEYGVDYVFYGPAEQSQGDFSPADAPYLQAVYDNGTVQIYRPRTP